VGSQKLQNAFFSSLFFFIVLVQLGEGEGAGEGSNPFITKVAFSFEQRSRVDPHALASAFLEEVPPSMHVWQGDRKLVADEFPVHFIERHVNEHG
jgi:hypothetical protein